MPKVRRKETRAEKIAKGKAVQSKYAAKQLVPSKKSPKYAYKDRESEDSSAFRYAFRQITGQEY